MTPAAAVRRALQWLEPRMPKPLRNVPLPALALISLLVVVNVAVWIAVAVVVSYYPRLTSTAVLAYTLGLRHALDADHISAIDLMTRRLIASGQRPVAVGTFFSLGHSTIVVITCIVVAATSGALRDRFDGFTRVGNIIGTSVSAAVLLILCVGNGWVLYRLVRGLRDELRRQHARAARGDAEEGEAEEEEEVEGDAGGGGGMSGHHPRNPRNPPGAGPDEVATYEIDREGPAVTAVATATAQDSPVARGSATAAATAANHLKLEGGGFLARVFRRLFVLIDRPWKMYPLGVLFGLGFDTSSEVALLGIASLQGANGTSFWLILIFPILFTAGMCLIDTTDGALMMSLYTSKAFARDTVAILYYSIVLTGITVVVSAFIGVIQVLTLVANVADDPQGRFWDGVGAIGDHFDIVGGAICGLFVLAAVGSVVAYRPWRRRMECRAAARSARRRAAAARADDEEDGQRAVLIEGV